MDALSKMGHLELLILIDVNCFGTLDYISNELRYLFWYNFPWTSLPSTFHPDQLVELILPRSNIKQLWKGKKVLILVFRIFLLFKRAKRSSISHFLSFLLHDFFFQIFYLNLKVKYKDTSSHFFQLIFTKNKGKVKFFSFRISLLTFFNGRLKFALLMFLL